MKARSEGEKAVHDGRRLHLRKKAVVLTEGDCTPEEAVTTLRFEQRKSQAANLSQISGRRKATKRGTINGETSMDPLFTIQMRDLPRNSATILCHSPSFNKKSF
jgi:hypothetical protein